MRTPLCTVMLVASHYDELHGAPEENEQLLVTVEQRCVVKHRRAVHNTTISAGTVSGPLLSYSSTLYTTFIHPCFDAEREERPRVCFVVCLLGVGGEHCMVSQSTL